MARLVLVCQRPEGGERRFELETGASYRIGARPDNDIVIDQKDVSRHHAVLRVHDGSLHITDLKSKNGTFVNGTRIESTSFECGDLVNVSSARMVVVDVGSGRHDVAVFVVDPESSSGGDASEDTQQYRGTATVHDLVELLEVSADSIRRGAAAPPLAWAVERLGLDGAAVLYRDVQGGVAMVTSAGDLGPLVSRSEAVTRLVVERVAREAHGPVIQEIEDLGERLLMAPLGRDHVLVVRFAGSPPSINDIRALVAATTVVVGSSRGDGEKAPSTGRSAVNRPGVEPALVGVSPAVLALRREIAAAAASGRPLLVSGEAGTGKALVARLVHGASARADGPFITLTIEGRTVPGPEVWDRQIQHAVAASDGGSLLVRRVDRLPSGHRDRAMRLADVSGVRLMASCGEDPADGADPVTGGWFRHGDPLVIRVPPLRERLEDVPLLAAHFLAASGDRSSRAFSPQAMAAMMSYRWPGNVRQLRRAVREMADPSGADRVHQLDDLPAEIVGEHGVSLSVFDADALADHGLADARDVFESWLIRRTLARCGGNQTEAARMLGLSRAGLFKKIRRLRLDV